MQLQSMNNTGQMSRTVSVEENITSGIDQIVRTITDNLKVIVILLYSSHNNILFVVAEKKFYFN